MKMLRLIKNISSQKSYKDLILDENQRKNAYSNLNEFESIKTIAIRIYLISYKRHHCLVSICTISIKLVPF